MEWWTLYLLLISPQIGGTLKAIGGIFAAVTAIGVVVSLIIRFDSCTTHDGVDLAKKCAKWITVIGLPLSTALLLLQALFPSTMVMYAIVAWLLGSNIEGASELPSALVEYLNTVLKNQIAELTESATSK